MILSSVTLTLQELLQTTLAIVLFGLCVLPSGYLASAVLPFSMRRGFMARSLWVLALGVPLTTALSVGGQRSLSRSHVNICFLVLLLIALGLLAKQGERPRLSLSRAQTVLLCAFAGLAAYCCLETLDLQIGSHLFLSSLINDWSPRIAMIGGAMRSQMPPLNGLSTLSGTVGFAPHLRYYYFWYVLIAQIAAPLSLRPQPVLAASCIWAGWGFLATCMLVLKHVLNAGQRWAQASLLFLATLCVLGLDILPTALVWLSRNYHPYLEMEWWREDRTPSFLGMLLASPHHVAAFSSLLCGTLLLFLLNETAEITSETTGFRVRKTFALFATFISAVLFANSSGLALFATLCFAFGLSFWAIDLLRRRHWQTLACLAGAGILALLLAHGYLVELTTSSSAAKGFLGFAWRSDSFAGFAMARFAHLGSHSPLVSFFLRQSAVAVLDLFELGFYSFVLVAAVRKDLLTPGRLSAGRCLWWSLLLGAAVPTFFLSSLATSGPNDLGFDAGFLFRLCLQLWAADWIRLYWSRRHLPRTSPQQFGLAIAISFAVLGLSAQLYQVLSIRLYFPVVGSGRAHKQMDVLTEDHLSERLYDLYAALQRFDHIVPPSHPDTEAIQFNPIGVMLAPSVYFNTHQIASWDTGCGTSFGGDYSHCAPVFQSLLFLYGNTAQGVAHSRALNTLQDGAADRVASLADFANVCQQLKLRAVVADATDSIWSHRESWVWTGPALVANPTVRVISCPAGSWRP